MIKSRSIFIYGIFGISYIMIMEINKEIKLGDIEPLKIKLCNILDVVKLPGYIKLTFWSPDDGRKEFVQIFDGPVVFQIFDGPVVWFDKDGNKSTDYQKLVDLLTVYAEQTKLKDAIASLN